MLRAALNIDGEKREDLHHTFFKLYETGHRRIRGIIEMRFTTRWLMFLTKPWSVQVFELTGESWRGGYDEGWWNLDPTLFFFTDNLELLHFKILLHSRNIWPITWWGKTWFDPSRFHSDKAPLRHVPHENSPFSQTTFCHVSRGSKVVSYTIKGFNLAASVLGYWCCTGWLTVTLSSLSETFR